MGLFWSPFVAGIILLQSRISGQNLAEAAVLVGPPMGVWLFMGLSIWYLCKTISFERYSPVQVFIRHLLSGGLMISVWLLAGVLYSEIMDSLRGLPIWRESFDQALPLLTAIGLLIYLAFCLTYYMILALEKSRIAEQRALENSLSASRAELASLKASVHPHFLFNSLTSLSALTRKSPVEAQKMCLQLADFLRYSLSYGKQEWVQVKDELEHVENYLGIEKIRFGDKLNADFSVGPEALDEKLPPFSLLPLMENAVKHGFQSTQEAGILRMEIRKTPHDLVIVVENPVERSSRARPGEGFGLLGLEKRLTSAYKEGASLTISRNYGTFQVKLVLPLQI
jgi:sensor histidine kinase YesM